MTDKKTLSEALVAIQAELKNPAFDSVNPHFKSKFASLATVRDTINSVATKHGIAVIQRVCSDGEAVGVQTVLSHESGETYDAGTITMVPPKRSDPQSVGSVIKYLRRYALMAAFNVIGDEDDDGNETSADAAVLAISRAEDLVELRYLFEPAYTAAKQANDIAAQKRIVAAKDARKKELEAMA